jgi:hypothetical protein|tara:strand:+ start:204 stop:893 length:690 start_codon:yes stop_codon:yes gene_type:complete
MMGEEEKKEDTGAKAENTEPDLEAAKETMYPVESDYAEQSGEGTEDEEAEEAEDTEDAPEEPEDKKKKEGAPELVTAEDLKFPEGAQINEEIQEKFLGFVNDNKMSAEQTQGLINLQAELNKGQIAAHKAEMDGWVKEVKSNVKFVGETGDKLNENLAVAKKGMEALNVKGLPELLDSTGLGNHPVFVEAFMVVGEKIGEDSFSFGSGAAGKTTPKEAKEILYPSHSKG